MTRPILASSCAQAATAAETRFRITYRLASARAVRVIGLDAAGVAAAQVASREQWHSTRLYSLAPNKDGVTASGLDLVDIGDGATRPLTGELDGVDDVIMVASGADGADAAATIGAACVPRGIMTAGLLLARGAGVEQALRALRPYARMLIVPADTDDLVELLRAIRA